MYCLLRGCPVSLTFYSTAWRPPNTSVSPSWDVYYISTVVATPQVFVRDSRLGFDDVQSYGYEAPVEGDGGGAIGFQSFDQICTVFAWPTSCPRNTAPKDLGFYYRWTVPSPSWTLWRHCRQLLRPFEENRWPFSVSRIGQGR